jgi:hypothetical protein
MTLELDNLIDYWGNKQLTPMVLLDENDVVTWRNKWADWLFKFDISNSNLKQLSAGDILTDYSAMVRKYTDPPLINTIINGMALDVEGRILVDEPSRPLILKFHTPYLPRVAMLEMHKFMQDFALETGDRVNNPLTTVINCLHILERQVGNDSLMQNFLELAIREAYVMKEFGDWVRRLSEEAPTREVFDLVSVLEEVLDRRGCSEVLQVTDAIPRVMGSAEHSLVVLGGLVNLMRQASATEPFWVKVLPRDRHMVTVEINSKQTRVKDLRMLSEEFYGGLGLLAARYLLSLMQAQLELEFMGDVGIRITFLTENTGQNRK